MVSRITTIGAVIILLVLFSLPLVLQNQPDPLETKTKTRSESQYNLTNVTLTGHQNGEKQWMLKVNTVMDRESGAAILDGLEYGEVYYGGEVKFFLTADKGEYDRSRDEFKLNDQVLVTTTDGKTIRADQLAYNLVNKRLVTNEVEVEGQDLLLHANNMTIDVNTEVFNFTGGVEVEFTIKDEGEK